MNDHQLLCFLTVQRTLNFTAAAKELYCTQPALSYQIRTLEKELDLTLFERSTTRVVLTAAGRAFVPHAEQLFQGVLNARTALKGFSAGRTPHPASAAGAAAVRSHLPGADGAAICCAVRI